MSEIRSQATPARDKSDLADIIHIHVCANNLEDCIGECHVAASDVIADGWSKPRTVNSATELKALPKCSLIRGLEREGQRSGDVFEKVGPDHWLCLDPGDRFDGEETTPSHAIVLIYKAGIRALFTPGDAG